ncbi:MAG: hypothetical protein WCK34_09865 [Bacteroidota bacterium]
MNFFYRLSQVLSLILLTTLLPAQKPLSVTSQRVLYDIPYHPQGGREYVCGNAILRELAKDVLREPWLVKIRVTCELGLSVVKNGSREQLNIYQKHTAVCGDTLYRHFPVTDLLIPTHVGMKLRWANRADTSGFFEETLSGKALSVSDSLLCTVPVTAFDPQVDTLMVRDVVLSYDSLALAAFIDRAGVIHDYYASVVLLDSLERFCGDMQVADQRQLPVNFLKIEELCRVISRIDARGFPGRLLINGYDPEGLMKRYNRLFRLSRSLVYNFIDENQRAGALPWDGNADRLAAFFTSRVLSYVSRSYLMDREQGLIYKNCLDHLFEGDVFPQEEEVRKQLLGRMFPSASPDTLARFISGRLFASYRDMAERLMAEKRFAEAYSMIENGRRFLAGIGSLQSSANGEDLLSRAAGGIFESYIGIASACIESHKFDMADVYLSRAEQYSAGHKSFITSDSAYRAVFSRLFFLRNVDCDALLAEKRYADAMACYQQFEHIYSVHDLALVRDRLDEKKLQASMGLGNISAQLSEAAVKHLEGDTALRYYQQARAFRKGVKNPEAVDARLDSLAPLMAGYRYRQIWEEGSAALEKRQFTLAVTRFREAKSLSQQAAIEPVRGFDSLYRQAMKNFLIVQLSAAQKKIWTSQFDSARAALSRTRVAGFDFGLLGDPGFSTAMKNYGERIVEQQCRNLHDSLDLRMIRADRSAALRNYRNVIRYFTEALQLAESDTACRIGLHSIADSVARYSQPALYQQNEASVHALVAMGDYPGAINAFYANQALFRTASLGRFGLHLTDLQDFIASKENPYLTLAALHSVSNNPGSPDMMKLLLLLKDQHVEAKQVKEQQEILGKTLAGADMRSNRGEDAAAALLKYPVDHEWFAVFRMSYTSERVRLNQPVKTGSE